MVAIPNRSPGARSPHWGTGTSSIMQDDLPSGTLSSLRVSFLLQLNMTCSLQPLSHWDVGIPTLSPRAMSRPQLVAWPHVAGLC